MRKGYIREDKPDAVAVITNKQVVVSRRILLSACVPLETTLKSSIWSCDMGPTQHQLGMLIKLMDLNVMSIVNLSDLSLFNMVDFGGYLSS
jgi:hypothetical protein